MNPSLLRQRIDAERKLRTLLEHRMLSSRAPMVAASLIYYRNVCGKKNCACKSGRTHGPYAYLSAKVKGKTKLKMVPQSRLAQAEAAVERYRQYQRALRRVRRLDRQLEGLYKMLIKQLAQRQ